MILGQLPERKSYNLFFYENAHGVNKRVELDSRSFVDVLAILRADQAKRDVDVMVDGKPTWRISHGPDGLKVRSMLPPDKDPRR